MPPFENKHSKKQNLELKNFKNLFFALNDYKGKKDLVEHKIEVTEPKIIRHLLRLVLFALRVKVDELVQDYLKRGVIRPSNSSY